MQKLMIAEFKSIAFGFRCLQNLSSFSGFEPIEASPLADGSFWIFAEVSQTETEAIEKKLRTSAWLKGLTFFAPDVLPIKAALYGLVPPKMKNYLGILEGSSIARLASVLVQLHGQHPFDLIELQPGKGDGGKCLAYITGERSSEVAKALTSLSENLVHCEIIENPSPLFKQYFDLEG